MRKIFITSMGARTRRGFRRVAALLLFALAMSHAARAQGSRRDDIVLNPQGHPIPGAIITVCTATATGTPCSPLAALFTDATLTVPSPNPFTTDYLGNYHFYAAPGRYIVQIAGSGILGTKQMNDVILPNDPSTPSFSTVTTSGAISALTLSLGGNLSVTGNTTISGSLTANSLSFTNLSVPGNVTVGGLLTTASLSGLSSPIVPTAAGGTTLGSASLPFSSLFLGAAATNNIQITGTATAARTLSLPDNTGTVAELNLAQTFTAAQTFSNDAIMGGGGIGDPFTDIRAYGAIGDYNAVSDGAMSSGSTTLTSASGKFAPGDVGKLIGVAGAGMPAPSCPTPTTSTSGGALPSSTTVYIKAYWIGNNGTSVGCSEVSVATGAGSTNTVSMTPPSSPPSGATGWVPCSGFTSGYEFCQAGFTAAPSAAPTLSSTSGSLGAGTYLGSTTCTYGLSDSPPSSDTSITVGASSGITFTAPSCDARATGWRRWLSTPGGTHSSETAQDTVPLSLPNAGNGVISATVTSLASGQVIPQGCTLNSAGTGCGLSSSWTGTVVYTETPEPPSSANLLTTIASFNSSTSVTLTVGNQSGGALSGARVAWGTDNTTAISNAVTACENLYNQTIGAGAGMVYFPPGAYAMSTMNFSTGVQTPLLWGRCSWMGESVEAVGTRLYWLGPWGGTWVQKLQQSSFPKMTRLAFRGEALNWNNLPGVTLDIIPNIDSQMDISMVHLNACEICARLDNGFINFDWFKPRVDGFFEWAWDVIINKGQNGSSFVIQGGSEVTNGNPATPGAGVFLFDNSASNTTFAGVAVIKDMRSEMDTANGTGFCASAAGGTEGVSKCGFVTLRSATTSPQVRWLDLSIRDLDYQPSSSNEYLVYWDGGTSSVTHQIQIQNVKASNGTLGGVCGGVGVTAQCLGAPTSGIIPYFSISAGTPSTFVGNGVQPIDLWTDVTNTPALGAKVSGDVNDRFSLGPDGKQCWGPGSAATDVCLSRSATGTLQMGASYFNANGAAPIVGSCTGLGSGSCTLLAGSNNVSGTIQLLGSGTTSSSGAATLTFGSAVGTNSATCLATLRQANSTSTWVAGANVQVEGTSSGGMSTSQQIFNWNNNGTAISSSSLAYDIDYLCVGK